MLEMTALDNADKVDPIAVVVKLLTEMKSQVEEEKKDDKAWYDKFMCWCKTNKKEKKKAIEDATAHLEELNGNIETAGATLKTVKSEIKVAAGDLGEDQESYEEVKKIRDQEKADFDKEEADLKETRELLLEAYKTLSQVQNGKYTDVNAFRSASAALLQVSHVVKRRGGQFHALMEKDLLGLMSSLKDVQRLAKGQSFLGEAQQGDEAPEGKPNDLKGAAAGAKSYNSRSGVIFGIIDEMLRQTSRDLAKAQKTELTAVIDFNKVNAAKITEIMEGKKLKAKKEAAQASLKDELAQDEQDLASTKETKAADEEYLKNVEKQCEEEEEKYKKRLSMRNTEVSALNDALKYLTEDAARDLFGKTMSFLQTSSVNQMSTAASAHAAAQERAAEKAMKRIAGLARQHRNWGLAALAVRIRLEKFDKVKESMDKLLAVLQAEQKEENQKREQCMVDIDKSEDDIKETEWKQENAEQKKTKLENEIKNLNTAIKELNTEISDMQISLKQASEVRKEENAMFQKGIQDQKATIQILQKVEARLKEVYEPDKSFIQMASQMQDVADPPKAKEYKKQPGTGILGALENIIRDADENKQNLEENEQEAQEEYEVFIKNTAASIKAAEDEVDEKKARKSKLQSEKSETKEDLTSLGQDLETFGKMLSGFHADCDFLLKYFDTRQQARQEEMDGIADAKAILSGARFPS